MIFLCLPSPSSLSAAEPGPSSLHLPRGDRASAGYHAFLEIRGDEHMLRVVEITAGGPADRAGLRAGDLLFAFDGEEMPCWSNDLERIRDLDRRFRAGETVKISFLREASAVADASTSGGQPPEAREEPKALETELTFEPMNLETQRELIHWVAVAEKRLAAGEALYCHDRRPSVSGTHYVCMDDSKNDP